MMSTLNLTNAARDVLLERHRQKNGEGFSSKHDDRHSRGELSAAALCYVQSALGRVGFPISELRGVPGFWPWDQEWWKPKSVRSDLVRAAALILAEIERLDRAAPQAPPQRLGDGTKEGTGE